MRHNRKSPNPRCRPGAVRVRHRALFHERLEPRQMLSGVTLVTHGFNSNVDGWVSRMAEAIASRPDLQLDQPRMLYRVVEQGDGRLEVDSSLDGPDPRGTDCSNPEIVLLLDWSDVAGGLSPGSKVRSTTDVARAVADALTAPEAWTQSALAELPLHLIGHSRGASMVAELARELGQRGVWVDQVTTLDPHPVDGVNEPWLFNYDFGDPAMASSENVVFWDNYWRSEGGNSFDFTGESVENVSDLRLSESVLSSGGYSTEHSDVHLWYHGTIDTIPPSNNGDYDVPDPWYGGVHPPRDASGFAFSRIVGGARPVSGMSRAVDDLGVVRAGIDWSAATWPNVLELAINDADSVFEVSESIDVSFFYQEPDGSATITFLFDRDRNPINGTGWEAAPLSVSSTGEELRRVPSHLVPTDLLAVRMVDYFLAARISDGARTRYAYTATAIRVVQDSPLDTSGDGIITPLDALLVINWLNGSSPDDPPPENLDVDRDGRVIPLDALLVINYLNGPDAEGEASPLPCKSTRWARLAAIDAIFSPLGADEDDEDLPWEDGDMV